MANTEIDVVRPTIETIEYDGATGIRTVRTDLEVLSIEYTAGAEFGRASFRYAASMDERSPVALSNVSVRPGMRILVYDYTTSTIYFQGWVMSREDQGAQDQVIFTAYDDRIMLQYIPIHGCIVRDDDGSIVFSDRYTTRTNPDGFWNCTIATINGVDYPVFAPVAKLCMSYESPDEAYPDVAYIDNGEVIPWTPRRWLSYLQLISTIGDRVASYPADVKGWNTDHARYLDSGKLSFSLLSITNLDGKDPALLVDTDPLDRKMPDMTFQGKTVLKALNDTLDMAMTHKMTLTYDSSVFAPPSTPPAGLTNITFAQDGYSSDGTPSSGTSLHLQREGNVDVDIAAGAPIYDFNFSEDYSEIIETMLVQGDVIKTETRVSYGRGVELSSSLIPAWTTAEQAAFLRIIHGSLPSDALLFDGDSPTEYPSVLEQFEETDTWVKADGTSGRPLVLRRSQESIAFAREMFPTVFRAYRLNCRNLSGALATDLGETGFVKSTRPILPTQLQFMIRNLLSGEVDGNWLKIDYPIRVSVYISNGESPAVGWSDAPFDVGVRVTDDGLIWLDGIAESQDESPYGIKTYSRTLRDAESYKLGLIQSNNIRLNVAMPTDYRVSGTASETLTGMDYYFSQSIKKTSSDFGLLGYVDSPGAYREHRQYRSFPVANEATLGGVDGSTAETISSSSGISRILPPGSEAINAVYAAKRKMNRMKHPKRNTSWKIVGINKSYRAGDWLTSVYFYDENGSVISEYPINAPINNVTLNFLAQVTIVGGISGEIV